jgi:hypothetical protein
VTAHGGDDSFFLLLLLLPLPLAPSPSIVDSRCRWYHIGVDTNIIAAAVVATSAIGRGGPTTHTVFNNGVNASTQDLVATPKSAAAAAAEPEQ